MPDTTHRVRVVIDNSQSRRGLAETERGLGRVEAGATSATTKAAGLGRAFAGVRAQVFSLTGALAGFSAGLAAIAAVRTIASFNDQMATVQSVTLATTRDLERLRDAAQQVGATTRFTATEAAQGLELLARAGAGTEGSLKLLNSTLQLAQAENLSLAEASDYLAKITQGMRLELGEGGRVADVLSQAASSTATDVRQLGTAMKYAATISSGFKTPVEEVAAALGVLANNGLVADQAGTAIRGLLSRVAAPTKEFIKDLKSVGLTIADISPETNTLVQILEKLAGANITTSNAFELFRQRAGTGAEILINNIDKVKELRSELEGAQGVLQKKFDIKADTLLNDLFLALSAVQNFIIVLGDAGLEAALRAAAQAFAFFVNTISSTISLITPLLQNIALGVAIAFSPFFIGAFAAGMARVIPLLAGIPAILTAIITRMAVLAAANPFVAVGIAIGAAITLAQSFDDSIRVAGTRYATLGDVFQAVGNRIKSAFKTIVDFSDRAFNAILSAGVSVANSLVGAFQFMADKVVDLLQGVLNFATKMVNVVGRDLNLGQIQAPDLGRVKLPEFTVPPIVSNILAEADDIALDRLAEEKKRRADLVATMRGQADVAKEIAATNAAGGAAGKQIDYTKQILTEIQGPADEAREKIGVLNDLFADGTITLSQYTDQLQRLREQLASQDQTFAGGIAAGLNKVAEGASRIGENVAKFVTGAFGHATDAIVEFAKTGKFSFKDLISSILEDLIRLSLNQLWGQLAQGLLGGFGGGFAPAGAGAGLGGLGSLLGFANGGSYISRGNGGTDSQVNMFRTTPGERVDVLTPQQQRRQGGGTTTVNVFNNGGGQVREERRRDSSGGEIVDVVIDAVGQGIARGALDGPMRGRFGSSPQTVRR